MSFNNEMEKRDPKNFNILTLLFYVVVGFAVFGLYLDNPFLMDDELQVTGNSAIQNIHNWLSYFFSSTMATGGMKSMGGIYFKPLMTLYYAIIWWLSGPNPIAFRIPILVLHSASAFFIFLFLKRHFDKTAAFVAGLLFLLHPANVEVVAYVADAQDALYLFFGLAALTISWSQAKFKYFWSVLLLAASILSKETGALFCIGIPIYLWLMTIEDKTPSAKFKSIAGSVAASFVVLSGYAILRWSAGLTSYHHATLLLQQAKWIERLQTTPIILWHYIEIFIFPWRISMVTDFVVGTLGFENFWLPLTADLVLLGALTAFIRNRSRKSPLKKPLVLFALSWLFIWFALHGNAILPLDGTYADRWLYFAFLPLLTLLLTALPQAIWRRKITLAVVGVIAGLFVVRDIARLKNWSVPIDLYARELELHPGDAVMSNNVGVEIFKTGNAVAARPYFQKATEINPIWDVAWNNLGASYQRTGDLHTALADYSKSASLGAYSLAYENYAGLLCSRAGTAPTLKANTLDGCFQFLSRAISIFPENERLREIEVYYRKQTTH